MKNRDHQDLAGGILLAALGVFVALYSQRYDFGTAARMGPGFFPYILGWVLAVLGVLVALPAWFRRGHAVTVQWKTAALVLGSIICFALLLRPAGILVATVAAAFLSTLADKDITWRGRVAVALGVAVVTWGIFIFGLSMRLPVWPAFISQ